MTRLFIANYSATLYNKFEVIILNKNDYIDIINILKHTYPDAKCSLDFKTPFELVVAVMLSAQCTDERVNKTTPALFAKYPSIEDFANANITELENIIHPCGFYKSKAKNVIGTAKKVLNDFNGVVPSSMKDLLTLPGIGRKSANVIMLEVFGNAQGVAVDTHCKRISNRLGLSKESDPTKIELDLIKKFPAETSKDVNHLFIYFGRDICIARNPKCEQCPLRKFCKS